MSEVIYVLTVIFVVYVIYAAEGDAIVAFIHKAFHIDLSHSHAYCTNALNRIKKSEIFKRH
jgi:hypothetical protein